MDLISFIAPTSKDRIAMIAKEATGFIYVFSLITLTIEARSVLISLLVPVTPRLEIT